MTEQRTTPSRVPQLELLRALATAAIFLFHLWSVVPLRADTGMLSSLLLRVPFLGALGVIVFNIITGFVLAVPYLGHTTPRPLPPLGDFFRQRFSRICLHYYPTLLLWTLIGLFVAHGLPGQPTFVAFVTHLGFVHTLSARTFFTIVPAFWWLGLVAQVYVLCPWLLRLYQWLGAGKACVLVCVLPWLGWLGLTALADAWPGSVLATVHYLIYFNVPVRLPEFALGMWFAAAWNRGLPLVHGPQTVPSGIRRCLQPCGAAAFLYVLLQTSWLAQFPRPMDHVYLVGWCGVTMLLILRWRDAVRLGNVRVVADFAAASYGIYLLHQPLLGYAHAFLPGTISAVGRFSLLLFVVGPLCYVASVGLTIVLYRFVRL